MTASPRCDDRALPIDDDGASGPVADSRMVRDTVMRWVPRGDARPGDVLPGDVLAGLTGAGRLAVKEAMAEPAALGMVTEFDRLVRVPRRASRGAGRYLVPRARAGGCVQRGDFLCPSVSAPTGTLTRADGGWRVDGTHGYASGAPYATHYLGQALPAAEPNGAPIGGARAVSRPRSAWTMLDWGTTLGLKGSGSNSVRFDGAVLPEDYVIENLFLIDADVTGGTAGYRAHHNPLYTGRTLSLFALNFAALVMGMALGAPDEYETIIRSKKTSRPPVVPRMHNAHYQRWLGKATSKLRVAEALVSEAAERYLDACRAGVNGERPCCTRWALATLLERGLLDPAPLLTKTFTLDEADQELRAALAHEVVTGALKMPSLTAPSEGADAVGRAGRERIVPPATGSAIGVLSR